MGHEVCLVGGNNLITSVFLCFQIVKEKKANEQKKNQEKRKKSKEK